MTGTNYGNAETDKLLGLLIERKSSDRGTAATSEQSFADYTVRFKSGSMKKGDFSFTYRTNEMTEIASKMKANVRTGVGSRRSK